MATQKTISDIPSPYALFEPRIVNQIAINGHTESIYPVNAVDEANNGPINFVIKGTSDYVDLSKTYLVIKGRFSGNYTVKPSSGDAVTTAYDAEAAKFGPVNILPHALFKSVDVTVNNQTVTLSDQNYMYRAYIQTLFNNNKDALEKIHSTGGWYKDVAGKMDSTDPGENTALTKRMARKNAKHEVVFSIHLHTPLFQMEKLLLSECDIEISLHRNNESRFFLMYPGTGDAAFKISQAILKVRKVTVSPEYATGIETMLAQEQPLEYLLDDPRITTLNIVGGHTSFDKENLTFGHLPRRIIVGMVETEAYNGNNVKNPFNFQHFKVRKIALYKNGLEYPTPPIIMDFQNKNSVEAYRHLMSSLHADNSPFVPDISEHDFANGFTLFSWEMTPDLNGGDNSHLIGSKNANIRLSVEFEEALKTPITLIIYYQLDMRMTINQSRQITIETS